MLKIGTRKTYFQNAMKVSEQAMQELKQEAFNSKTLRTLFYDKRFQTKEPNAYMVQSRETGEPVKIYSRMDSDMGLINDCHTGEILSFYDIYFFPKKELLPLISANIGKKNFIITYNGKNYTMQPGYMETRDDNLKGIGIREDQKQVEIALKHGINKIDRISFPQAIIYHLKMGFTPVQKLIRVRFIGSIEKRLKELTDNAIEIEKDLYTPIIVQKSGLFGKRYYFDRNTTQALACLRKSKQKFGDSKRPELFSSINVPMELIGENLQKWKDMITGEAVSELK